MEMARNGKTETEILTSGYSEIMSFVGEDDDDILNNVKLVYLYDSSSGVYTYGFLDVRTDQLLTGERDALIGSGVVVDFDTTTILGETDTTTGNNNESTNNESTNGGGGSSYNNSSVPSWSGTGDPPHSGGNWVLHRDNGQEIAWHVGETGDYDRYGRWFYYPSVAAESREYKTERGSAGGGGGGGGGDGGGGGGWSETYEATGGNSPSWWTGATKKNPSNKEEAAMLINAMIPYLSPEDQLKTAAYLYINYTDEFPGYAPSIIDSSNIPDTGNFSWETLSQNTYTAQRGADILSTLSKISDTVGRDKMGPGFEYLQEIGGNIQALTSSGGVNHQNTTRTELRELETQLRYLLQMTEDSDLAVYGPVSKMLMSPFYTAGNIQPIYTLDNGTVLFGYGNRSFF